MSRLEIGDRGMAIDPRDSKRKDKLITGCCILINIYKGKNEMRGKIYSKILNEGKQKSSTRLSNRVIVGQGMKNECHHHIKEPQTFCKARAWGVLALTPRGGCLIEERQEFVFGHCP